MIIRLAVYISFWSCFPLIFCSFQSGRKSLTEPNLSSFLSSSSRLFPSSFRSLSFSTQRHTPGDVYDGIESGSLDVVKRAILSLPALFSTQKDRKETPLEAAILYKRVEIFSFLLDYVKSISVYDDDVLLSQIAELAEFAVKYGNLEALRSIYVRFGSELFANRQLLPLAARHNASFEMLEFLCDEVGLAGEIESTSPLSVAIAVNLFSPFLFFAKRSAELFTVVDEAISMTPMLLLIKKGRARMLSDALDYLSFLTTITDKVQNETLLHMAAREGQVAIVSLLLRAGANVHAENNLGKTALQCLFSNEFGVGNNFPEKKREVFAKLLEGGADVFERRTFELIISFEASWAVEAILKKSPESADKFIQAAGKDQLWWLAEDLIRNGVFVDVTQWPANWKKILSGDCDLCLTLLLEHYKSTELEGIPVNFMHSAAEADAAKIIKTLVDHGFNVNQVDEMYQCPLHYALIFDNIAAAKAILACPSFTPCRGAFSLNDIVSVEMLQLIVTTKRINLVGMMTLTNLSILNLFTTWNHDQSVKHPSNVHDLMNNDAQKLVFNFLYSKRKIDPNSLAVLTIKDYVKSTQISKELERLLENRSLLE